MAKDETCYGEAKLLYVLGRTLEEISQRLPVSRSTLKRWRQQGGWKRRRDAALATPRSIAQVLRELLQVKLAQVQEDRGLNVKDFEAIARGAAAIDRLERGSYDFRAAALEVMDRFIKWLGKTLPDSAQRQQMGDLVKEFFKAIE